MVSEGKGTRGRPCRKKANGLGNQALSESKTFIYHVLSSVYEYLDSYAFSLLAGWSDLKMIKVVNKRTHITSTNDIYIGRGSALGNPFTGSHKVEDTKAEFQCESREEAIAKYEKWLDKKIKQKDPQVRVALNDIYLKAKNGNVNLVCYCAPKACHGDVIKQIIELVLRKSVTLATGGGMKVEVKKAVS